MTTINNGASMLIKKLEELRISLIRDIAIAFFLAVDEPFKKENIHRYIKRDNENSPWPKIRLEIKYNNNLIEKGIGIDLVFEDMKYSLNILLESCITNRDVVYYLSYYYFSKRGALNIEDYYSADVECFLG